MIATSANVQVSTANKLPKKTAVAFAVGRADDAASLVADAAMLGEELSGAAQRLIDDASSTGKPGEVATAVVDGTRLLLVGVGDAAKSPGDAARRFGATAAKQAKKYGLNKVALVPPPDGDEAATTGFLLGAFSYREYRGNAAGKRDGLAPDNFKLTILGGDKKAVARGEAIGIGQNYARTVASRPGNDINPPTLAKEAQRLAKQYPTLSCRVMDHKELAERGMGGILAVGAGSGSPPRMIVLEHKPKGTKKGSRPLLVVGKAITFDTGGLSLKPAASMPSMIFDKCGGMAALGAMAALAHLNADRHVVGILAAAENTPGPTAYRPGDILTMYNGVTVDITNTDAEGRLVLADALSWGIEHFKPTACVDLATLTGACVVALGNDRAGAWCNDDELFNALNDAASSTGEKLWRMPLGDDYRDLLRAPSADIVNAPGRYGGACTAAEFLHHFIPGNTTGDEECAWCHLDIAGPATTDKETALYDKGATGFGVRTLVAWATA